MNQRMGGRGWRKKPCTCKPNPRAREPSEILDQETGKAGKVDAFEITIVHFGIRTLEAKTCAKAFSYDFGTTI
jgi:hypothetical protein